MSKDSSECKAGFGDGLVIRTLDGKDALRAEQVHALIHHETAQPSIQPAKVTVSLNLKAHRCHAVIVLVVRSLRLQTL